MMLADRLLQVFHWPAGHPIRLLLPGMLLLSFVLHVTGIYLLRATPSARDAVLPPLPAKVVLLPGDAGKGVAPLLELRDPAWVMPGRFRDRLLPVPERRRSVQALQPELPPLLAPPSGTVASSWIPAVPPLADVPVLEPRGGSADDVVFTPVAVRFDPPGPVATGEALARLRNAAPAEATGTATEMLVVIDSTGQARHAWLLRGSGNPSLDLAAQRAVQRSRFGETNGGYRGVLRVIWAPRGGAAP